MKIQFSKLDMQQKQGLERNLPWNAYIRKEEKGHLGGSVV